jgi:hypothetical protein
MRNETLEMRFDTGTHKYLPRIAFVGDRAVKSVLRKNPRYV